MYFLGYDVGSSSVKACLLDGDTGRAVARASEPNDEMVISSPNLGWAEQDPGKWWDALELATRNVLSASRVSPKDIAGIGISYQMHGLVTVDVEGRCLRPAIIWCDGRAVAIGERAFRALGQARCLEHLLNSPGNFTASKLRWVREEEPAVFGRVHKFLLPGDFIAWAMTGRFTTTMTGLSEGILWDFVEGRAADFVLDYFEIPRELVPEIVPTFGEQGVLTPRAAARLGLRAGTPVTFRAGDQPANALALNVLAPGDIAANAGTSGVVYGVTDTVRADPESRVNSFAHVNHEGNAPRLGVLLCINGAGSAYSWLRRLLGTETYAELDAMAESASLAPIFFPFGNGPERMLGNRTPGARWEKLDFNAHGREPLARAVLEGVAFSFVYGIGILAELGLRPGVMRVGLGNMMKSRLLRETLADASGVPIELYDTDGAEGAARGAALGAGHYRSSDDAFVGLDPRGRVEPGGRSAERSDAYESWSKRLQTILS